MLVNTNTHYKPILRLLLHTNIDQTLVDSLHGLSNGKIGGLDCHVITTEYSTRVHCIHMYHLLCNTLVHVIYSGVSGQCSHTIQVLSYIYHNSIGLLCEQEVRIQI